MKVLSIQHPKDNQKLFGSFYYPEKPKALVVMFHGMAETRFRYDEIAQKLENEGFAVLVCDHRGHGDSLYDGSLKGYFADRDGWLLNLDHLHLLIEEVRKVLGDIPMILFGHSMGSLFARSYLKRYGSELSGVYLSGSPAASPILKVAQALISLIVLGGKKKESKLMDKLSFGEFNKGVKNPKTAFDWLSVDEDNVRKYINDPLCGYVFTAQGYKDLLFGLSDVYAKDDWFGEKKDLPIRFVSGELDPAGAPKQGVEDAANTLMKHGYSNVSVVWYPGVRHEIFLDVSKEKVHADLIEWCHQLVEKP